MSDSEKGSSSFWLYLESFFVAAGIWRATGKFWQGAFVFLFLMLGCSIPVIGHILCFVLGIMVGVELGMISLYLTAPMWMAWVIGIVMAIIWVGINLESRRNL